MSYLGAPRATILHPSEKQRALAGTWTIVRRQIPEEICPDRIDLGSGGLFFGWRDVAGESRPISAGTWTLDAPDRVTFSVDSSLQSFRVALDGEFLAFSTAGGKTCLYARKKEAALAAH